MAWKTIRDFFHGVETFFPRCGKRRGGEGGRGRGTKQENRKPRKAGKGSDQGTGGGGGRGPGEQGTEDRGQRTEDGGRRTEDGGQGGEGASAFAKASAFAEATADKTADKEDGGGINIQCSISNVQCSSGTGTALSERSYREGAEEQPSPATDHQPPNFGVSGGWGIG